MVAVLLILWPIAELFVAIEVARAIGVLETIVLLIIGWPIGLWALRTQGAAAWRRLNAAVSERRPPAREVVDGTLVLFGGILLMIPGFISDVVGIAMLLPPTRVLMRPLLVRNFTSRVVVRASEFGFGRQRRQGRPDHHDDVDSTARDIDRPQLRS